MDLVRHHKEGDDDVIHPSWRQLIQHDDGGRTSDIYSDGPYNPAEIHDNRSSGNVCTHGQPVKHTRFRYDDSQYTDDPVDHICETGEYADGPDVNTQERGEYCDSREQVNDGQLANTSEFLPISYSCDNGVVYERYQSSAFIQLAPGHETGISDGLNTHEVYEYRNGDRDEEVSNRDASVVVGSHPTAILQYLRNGMR